MQHVSSHICYIFVTDCWLQLTESPIFSLQRIFGSQKNVTDLLQRNSRICTVCHGFVTTLFNYMCSRYYINVTSLYGRVVHGLQKFPFFRCYRCMRPKKCHGYVSTKFKDTYSLPHTIRRQWCNSRLICLNEPQIDSLI